MHLLTLVRVDAGTETAAEHPHGLLRLTVETARSPLVACHSCGVLAADHGRREHRLADASCFGTPVHLIWRNRRWRCREPRCPTGVWSEEHPALPALLGVFLGLMVCCDLGGAISRTAVAFGIVGVSGYDPSKFSPIDMTIMAAVVAAGMVPALGMTLATLVRRRLFTEAERA
ncbi:transposase family protein [Streptomyces sp. QTS52]